MKPENRLLRAREVADLLGCSVGTVWTMARNGQIAQPIKLASRCTRWRFEDLAPILKATGPK